ncbi:MAG: NADH-quinone oxidoreductase subunit C [Candidatus Omnitrophica bacterium]|nr:NADH-quinone oxidoreductase subunit C [Candidatus Omnitrophota bacterium]
MIRSEILKNIQDNFKNDIKAFFEKSSNRVYMDISSSALLPMASYLFKVLKARFNIASGVDTRENFEILYHFSFDELDLIVSLRVVLPKDNPQVVSLALLCEGANWIEREITEMLGIHFIGHPDMKRLLLPPEWPEGVYPLRRDYKEWDSTAIRDRGV